MPVEALKPQFIVMVGETPILIYDDHTRPDGVSLSLRRYPSDDLT
jgi:hypothetical protein